MYYEPLQNSRLSCVEETSILCGKAPTDPRTRMLDAGERLLEALSKEATLSKRLAAKHSRRTLEQWKTLRSEIDQLAIAYVDALEHHRSQWRRRSTRCN